MSGEKRQKPSAESAQKRLRQAEERLQQAECQLQHAAKAIRKLENCCSREMLLRSALTKGTLCSFEVDLTDDKTDLLSPADRRLEAPHAGGSYVEYVRRLASGQVHPDHLAAFLCSVRREELLRRQAAGEHAVQHEFLCVDDRWLEYCAQLVRDAATGHVYAVVFVRDISARKQEELRLRERARRDPLTGVLQRNAARAEVDSWCAAGKGRGALLIVDIDDFKHINDTYGHVRGDLALCRFAEEIRATFHLDDVIGRIGGDEFVVLLKDAPSDAFAAKHAGALCRRVVEASAADGSYGSMSCSVGIALFPAHGTNFDELYEKADEAQYHAKRCGKNQVSIYGEFDGTDVMAGNFTSAEWLLDEISEYVYVCRESDSRLLYVNRPLREAFPLPEGENYFQHACYEVLLGRMSPCADCHKDELPEAGFLDWEYHNPILQRTFHIKGKRLLWNGIPAYLECAVDITPNVEKLAALQELQYRAERDVLTDLYNRETFSRKVEDLLYTHPQQRFVMMLWDIERFKVVNDLFGVSTGDSILRGVADMFSNYTGRNGVCGRLEADHFAVCLPREMVDMDRLCAEVDDCIEQFQLNYKISSSFGLYAIENVTLPVDQMCDRANLAQRTVKGTYLARYAWYDETLRNSLLDEQEIVSGMHMALEEGQFILYAQPIYSISLGRPVSAEILVRWKHPEKGFIPPSEFIPLFERNGFVMQLDAYVWELACRHLRRMLDAGLKVLPVSINISRINLFNPNLCDELIDLVRRYDLAPALLKLEITESAYTENQNTLLEVMSTLQKYGFVMLMDDFGSGYSSLNMLKNVPVDVLKIDMRFLSDIETSGRSGNILTSIVRMAKWLDMDIIAEGVETRLQLDFLCSIGCDKVQGYFYSRPLPLKEYEALIQNCPPVLPPPLPGHEDFDAVWNADPRVAGFLRGMMGGVGLYEVYENNVEVMRVNDAYYEITGCTPEALFQTSKDVLQHVLPPHRAPLLQACRQAATLRRAENLLLRRRRHDGTIVWLDVNVRFVGSAGPRSMFYFFFTDVTRHVTEYRRLEAERAMYRLAASGQSMVCFDYNAEEDSLSCLLHDAQGLFRRMSVLDVLKRSRLRAFMPREDAAVCRRLLLEGSSGTQSGAVEVFLKKTRGPLHGACLCRYASLHDKHAGLTGCVVGVLTAFSPEGAPALDVSAQPSR